MSFRVRAAVAALCSVISLTAHAEPECRTIEVAFKPTADLQIAVWIEDDQGNYVDTAYLTRATGAFGLANRPGHHLMKSDYRWPYGRRDMVLPVWAHRRNKQYGLVKMGGKPGYSEESCLAGGAPASECDDDTIGYHFFVSSPEPYYCSPSGGTKRKGQNGVDVISCASSFYGSKGSYAPGEFSLYPPRADLTSFDPHDGADAKNFASHNDVVAISAATPKGAELVMPAIRWAAPRDGNYVVWIETSLEGDTNAFHNHPAFPEPHDELSSYGKISKFGQPSVVYRVPVVVGKDTRVEVSSQYEGYGDWDGATGELHLADMTISDEPGTGAGRLLSHSDSDGSYRVKVIASPTCGTTVPGSCPAPEMPVGLEAKPSSSTIELNFSSATSGAEVARYDVRYRENMPITDKDFPNAIPSSVPPPAPGPAGSAVSTLITGLRPDVSYSVAVRALSTCSSASKIATLDVHTAAAQYTILHGCFIATAAFGSTLATQLGPLRAIRDRYLLPNPLGTIVVAAYYTVSPPLARVIGDNQLLRNATRGILAPLVEALTPMSASRH